MQDANDTGRRAAIAVHVLGDLSVTVDGEPAQLPPSRKTRALLAYLACVGRPQRRERLCEMFWEIPDDPRGALRWSLSKIRQIAGDALEADRNQVRIAPGAINVDLVAVARLTQAEIADASTEALEDAAQRFRGAFLADLALHRCPEFEAWRVAMADQMELVRIRVLRALIERLSDEPQRALPHAYALQSLLPEEEGLGERIAALGAAARQQPKAPAEPGQADDDDRPAAPATAGSDGRATVAGDAALADPLDQSRRIVSILAIDLAGPAMAGGDMDPEDGLQEIEGLQKAIGEVLARHSASVLEIANGQVTAAFGVEGGVEDHAFFACRAALEARRIAAEGGPSVQMRAGIDTGEVVARQRAGAWELSGSAPRQARRLADGLAATAIVLSARARVSAGGYVVAEPVRAQVGSFLAEDNVQELLGENRAQCRWYIRSNRSHARLIGREAELHTLEAAWKAAQEGSGVVVGIAADPGLGKSRLTHEFLAQEAGFGAKIHECGALEPDAEVSYHTIRKLAQELCGMGMGEEPSAQMLARLMDDLQIEAWHQPALEFLTGLGEPDELWNSSCPPERARRIAEAMRCVVAALARRSPLILLFEDMHWMDPESDAVFHRLADAAERLPVLMIATYRPAYHANWLARAHCRQIRLNRFTGSQMRELVGALVGEDESLAGLRHALANQADGTPFFVEEAVRSLAESGQISGAKGAYRASGPLDAMAMPSTIQSVISARILGLPAAQRSLVQIASVIGKDVPARLLRDMSPLDDASHAEAVQGLLACELLYEVNSYPVVEYTLKHALIRRVAYKMLLRQDRVVLHRRALELLERELDGALEANAEKLAAHAARAEEWARAAPHAIAAARKALGLSNPALARKWLAQAAEAVARMAPSAQSRQWAADLARLERLAGARSGDGEAPTAIA